MSARLLSQFVPTTISGAILAIPVLVIGYQLWLGFYNLLFHPLRKFPGPLLCKVSALPLIVHHFRGDSIFWLIELHEKYGECVRLTPNELSFSGADAYKDIYSHKKAGKARLDKDFTYYRGPETLSQDINNCGAEDHARIRRIFSNAFSDKSLKLQESLFLTYTNKLVNKIQNKGPDAVFDMVRMYNYTTFDIMSDLAFGEQMGMLDNDEYHPWVASILAGFHFGVYIHSMRYFPTVGDFLKKYCIPQSLKEQMKLHGEFSMQKVNRRIEKKDPRPDIWGLVLDKEGDALSNDEMYANANFFMIAGTETTATLLAGLTYYLLANPDKLDRLVKEVRSSFQTEEDITIERLRAMPYLHACLEEGLRIYPSIPQPLPRVTPPGPPTTIDGRDVPAGAIVYVPNLAAFRNPNNFVDPLRFIPERWLTDSPEGAPYLNEKKHAFQPFSLGSRGCLGKNMAYHEMRLIIATLLFHFDISLAEETRKDWNDQKVFVMWEKSPLLCHFRPVQR